MQSKVTFNPSRLRLEQLESLPFEEALLSTDSQDLDPFRESYPGLIAAYCDDVQDLTGVWSVALDGAFTQVWVTCWKRPFDAHSEYTRIV